MSKVPALLVVVVLTGCQSTLPPPQPMAVASRFYEPLVTRSPASMRTMMGAVEQVLVAEGGTLSIDPSRQRLEGIVPRGEHLRDRLVVEVRAESLAVEVYSEIEADGRWLVGNGVCSSYSYARERLLADQIVNHVDVLTRRSLVATK